MVKTVKTFDAKRPYEMTVEWDDGETTTFNLQNDTIPDAVYAQLAWHGLKQKLMDAHAGGLKEHGTIAECRRVTDEVFTNLKAGTWNAGGRTRGGWVVEAMMELFDQSREEVMTVLDGMDEKDRKKLSKHPQLLAWKAARDQAKYENADAADLADMFTAEENDDE